MRLRRVVLAAWLASALNAWPIVAQAHDPSMYGGLFRTHDAGATWFPVVTDRYVSAVLAAAVSPTDSNHLLMGTTTGLYRSRNRGRDWVAEMRGVQASAAYAVTFDSCGQQALVSTGVALFRDDSKGNWTRISMPAGAAPARALVAGPLDGQVYLAGSSGLYRSDDFGGSWKQADSGLPHAAVTALVVSRRPAQELYAVVAGRLWKGTDAGGTWRASDSGLPANAISAVLADPTSEGVVWAAGADRLFRSEDGGNGWHLVGQPLPVQGTSVRGIAVSGSVLLLSTSRGLYRTTDGAAHWQQLAGNLPAHLEAAPLIMSDPPDSGSWYAGFSIVPYDELWRTGGSSKNSLTRLKLVNLLPAAAFLALFALASGLALRRLRRYYRSESGVTRIL